MGPMKVAVGRYRSDRGSRGEEPPWAFGRAEVVRVGLWSFLATVVMLFAAFASALLVRRAGADWRPVALPAVVWANAAVLVSASGLAEAARRSAHREAWPRTRRLLAGLVGLGALFLVGQAVAWYGLASRGLGLATNPHAAFFYVLSGLHALHLTAALVVAGYGAAYSDAPRTDQDLGATWPDLAAVFWHVLTGLWLWVLALLAWPR